MEGMNSVNQARLIRRVGAEDRELRGGIERGDQRQARKLEIIIIMSRRKGPPPL